MICAEFRLSSIFVSALSGEFKCGIASECELFCQVFFFRPAERPTHGTNCDATPQSHEHSLSHIEVQALKIIQSENDPLFGLFQNFKCPIKGPYCIPITTKLYFCLLTNK